MTKLWNKYKEKPLLLCVMAWVLFPCMYLIVGILTGAKLASVNTAFYLAYPLGISALLLWVLAAILAVRNIIKKRGIVVLVLSLVAFLLSVIPVFLFIYGSLFVSV